ncbi:hypothetical protein ARMGADRAFT_1031067 [Armillaria gallica]|uniref:ABC transmembrane type-1 domain-containing protein n=1 Tax=Armillaria gallica TaxID=47427 RepID=A0A2H3DV53_ARMGA|nr:hypothetical protein ARMGADRAFT_1031067 [Armillaria gallica]
MTLGFWHMLVGSCVDVTGKLVAAYISCKDEGMDGKAGLLSLMDTAFSKGYSHSPNMFGFLYNQHIIAVQAAGAMSLASVVFRPMEAHSLFEAITFAADIYGRQLPSDIYAGEVSVPGTTRIGDPFPSRIDNPTTLDFLRNAGRSGYLIDARVSLSPLFDLSLSPSNRHLRYLSVVGLPATVLDILCPTLTVTAAVFLGCIRDWWTLGVLMTLMISRLINLVVAMRRSTQDLSGQASAGEYDLLIRFNQDRWIRLRGTEIDLRTVVACQGMRPSFAMEGFTVFFGTVSAYLAIALSPQHIPGGMLGYRLPGVLLLHFHGLAQLLEAVFADGGPCCTCRRGTYESEPESRYGSGTKKSGPNTRAYDARTRIRNRRNGAQIKERPSLLSVANEIEGQMYISFPAVVLRQYYP